MRKNRVVEQNRCYHLVSRLAHRAFFLDDGEKDRAVALMAERPEGYRWCSFTAAVRGDRNARAEYAFMYGGGEWRVIRECHEQSKVGVCPQESSDRIERSDAPIL